MSDLKKPKAAAEEMGISTATITRCKQRGAPVHYVGTCGKYYLIDVAEFMAWMNSQGEQEQNRANTLPPSVLELRARRHRLCCG